MNYNYGWEHKMFEKPRKKYQRKRQFVCRMMSQSGWTDIDQIKECHGLMVDQFNKDLENARNN